MNLNQENWDRICSILVDEYGMLKAQKETFIDKLSVYSVEGNLVILLIDESIRQLKQYVSSKYEQPLKVTISEFFDEDCEVSILTLDEIKAFEDAKGKPDKTEIIPDARPQERGLALNPKYTFESFVVGKNNELAFATALAVAKAS